MSTENKQVPATAQRQLPAWKDSLMKAEGKFLAITDQEKTKVELGFASMAMENSEVLQKCDPASIINAVINVARTGITLNPVLRLAYLVPRGGKCVLDFSYMGLIKMLKDNGSITNIEAFIVYEDEQESGKFKYDITNNVILHEPIYAKTEEEQKKRKYVGAYSRAILPDKSIAYCFMPAWEIDKVKKVSQAAGSKYSPWNTWEEEMIKKTVLKRHFKMLISGSPSKSLAAALEVDEEANGVDFKGQQAQEKATAEKSRLANIFGQDSVQDAEVVSDTAANQQEQTKEKKQGEMF